jgi:hypothetical protein
MRYYAFLWLMLGVALCSCAWNKSVQEQEVSVMSGRAESVGFFSWVHRGIRDAERGAYGLMYGARDGYDGFIYDVQKDYYEGYQK